MDRINEQLYQANIELVDRNKLLEKDVSILQKRIERALEYVEDVLEYEGKEYTNVIKETLKKILKGEENGDNW